MTDSPTLVLEISKLEKTLKTSVFEKEELASTIRNYTQSAPAWPEIDKLCSEVISLLNKSRGPDSTRLDNLKKTGQLLWEQLLGRGAKERLKKTQKQYLLFSLDEELIRIPWELLYTGEDFLCLRFNTARLIRTKEQTQRPKYRSLNNSSRMLILADPSGDLKSAYQEGIYIKNRFGRETGRIKIDFKSTLIDTLYVKKTLRDYDIVHFAGHCQYQPDNPRDSGWLLSNGTLKPQDILAIAETSPLPSLVFSNACHSAEENPDLIDADYQEKAYSLASAFLFSGTKIYIGAIQKIEDPSSLAFAKEFYSRLIRGNPVGQALRLSRLKLIEQNGPSSLSWANYILYGDANFLLFPDTRQAKPFKVKRDFSPRYKKRIKRLIIITVFVFASIYCFLRLKPPRPDTYIAFIKSRQLLNQGQNEETILKCRKIIQKDPLFLSAYPLIAEACGRTGRIDDALKYYFEYAFQIQKTGREKILASSYIMIGWLYQQQGKYPESSGFYNKALALSRQTQDRLNEAASLRKLALWHMDKEDYNTALDLLTKSSNINLDRQNNREHRYNLACDYFNLGLLFVNKNDLPTAREFYRKSLRIFGAMRLKNELSDYYFNLGEICLFDKEYEKALSYYQKGLKIDQYYGDLPAIASGYNMLGELYLEIKNPEKAEDFLNQSAAICKQINLHPVLASVYRDLGLLHKLKGNKDKAREYLSLACDIYQHIDTPDYQSAKEELASLSSSF